MYQIQQNNGITWVSSGLLRPCAGLRHGFSTRLGGVSEGSWQSLNMGLHSGDDPAHIIENRTRFMRRFDIQPEQVASLHFVHSTKVVAVDASHGGCGFLDATTAIDDADGMMTATPGIALFVTFADCVPLLFFDPERRVAAATHAGWRGTVAGIAQETVRSMQATYGCDPASILVSIGPAIGKNDFEVGHEVVEAVRQHTPQWRELFQASPNGRNYFDIQLANVWQLRSAGVTAAHIERIPLSTFSRRELFFSHRRAGGKPTGRMGAFVYIDA